jgi:protocatechuate 3,4-dioxygenase beta subunit
MRMDRRRLLGLCLGAPLAALAGRRVFAATQGQGQGLDGFTVPGVACSNAQPTPSAPDPTTFRAGSPERSSLVGSGARGHRLVVVGTVAGVICGPIKGAVMDFWQADAAGHYDGQGHTLRGHQRTDDGGRYRLETIEPGAAPGRARRLHVRISPPGKATFATQLFFPDDPARMRDPAFNKALVVALTPGADEDRATFNFVLNL